MKIEYIGKSEEHDCREAYITWNEKSAYENKKADAIYSKFVEQGIEAYCEDGCMSIPVFDKEEFEEIKSIYKGLKKEFKPDTFQIC